MARLALSGNPAREEGRARARGSHSRAGVRSRSKESPDPLWANREGVVAIEEESEAASSEVSDEEES